MGSTKNGDGGVEVYYLEKKAWPMLPSYTDSKDIIEKENRVSLSGFFVHSSTLSKYSTYFSVSST